MSLSIVIQNIKRLIKALGIVAIEDKRSRLYNKENVIVAGHLRNKMFGVFHK